MFGLFKKRHRATIASRPFPAAWAEIVARNVPYVATLDQSDAAELRTHIQVFLAEKHFEGCGGLELTEEIRVTVAAQACVLLLHRETDYYPRLESILVYPSTYLVPGGRRPDGTVGDDPEARLGESWSRGLVVLAWDSVLFGASDLHDGHNVVLHEFAHQLDQEGDGNGAPVLPRRSMYVAWARVLGDEYATLLHEVQTGHRHDDVINSYGATNPAEFFAVVTEAFFEKPHALRARHPALYEQLKTFYLQDPAERVRDAEK